MITGGSVILSEIARSTKQNCNIKKCVDRFESRLDLYSNIESIVDENYQKIATSLINPRKLYFVDGGYYKR